MTEWTSEAIETVLAAQGIRLAEGRAARLARGVNAMQAEDPLRQALPFETDPTTYAQAVDRCKPK